MYINWGGSFNVTLPSTSDSGILYTWVTTDLSIDAGEVVNNIISASLNYMTRIGMPRYFNNIASGTGFTCSRNRWYSISFSYSMPTYAYSEDAETRYYKIKNMTADSAFNISNNTGLFDVIFDKTNKRLKINYDATFQSPQIILTPMSYFVEASSSELQF